MVIIIEYDEDELVQKFNSLRSLAFMQPAFKLFIARHSTGYVIIIARNISSQLEYQTSRGHSLDYYNLETNVLLTSCFP